MELELRVAGVLDTTIAELRHPTSAAYDLTVSAHGMTLATAPEWIIQTQLNFIYDRILDDCLQNTGHSLQLFRKALENYKTRFCTRVMELCSGVFHATNGKVGLFRTEIGYKKSKDVLYISNYELHYFIDGFGYDPRGELYNFVKEHYLTYSDMDACLDAFVESIIQQESSHGCIVQIDLPDD